MMSGGWVDVTPRDEMRQRIRDLEASLAAATERAEKAESELASATDLANSWARETGVGEARDGSGLRDLVDRLWGTFSGRYFKMQERAERAERELAKARVESDIANSTIGVLKDDLAKEREAWTDESGTVWNRPTAWAYQQVCRALRRSEAELVEARKGMARMEGAL